MTGETYNTRFEDCTQPGVEALIEACTQVENLLALVCDTIEPGWSNRKEKCQRKNTMHLFSLPMQILRAIGMLGPTSVLECELW